MLKENPITITLSSIHKICDELDLKDINKDRVKSESINYKDHFPQDLLRLIERNQTLVSKISSGDKKEISKSLVHVMISLQNMKSDIENVLDYIDEIFKELV